MIWLVSSWMKSIIWRISSAGRYGRRSSYICHPRSPLSHSLRRSLMWRNLVSGSNLFEEGPRSSSVRRDRSRSINMYWSDIVCSISSRHLVASIRSSFAQSGVKCHELRREEPGRAFTVPRRVNLSASCITRDIYRRSSSSSRAPGVMPLSIACFETVSI